MNNNSSTDDDINDENDGPSRAFGIRRGISDPLLTSLFVLDANMIRRNFLYMSILFAINHGCSVSVLGLANAKLGTAGVWSSGTLYASYTLSALIGASYIVGKLGSRNGLVVGMAMVALYVASFYVALAINIADESKNAGRYIVVIGGAVVGGVGSSILWVSQGSYFATASRLLANQQNQQGIGIAATSSTKEDATSEFGASFAFVFLLFEVILRLLSTFLVKTVGLSWEIVFGWYAFLSILPVCAMLGVVDIDKQDRRLYDPIIRTEEDDGEDEHERRNDQVEEDRRPPLKAMAALNLMWKDPLTKYLSPICILFGLSTSFASSILNGEIIQRVLSDPNSTYVGLYTAITSLVAAIASLVFGYLQSSNGRMHCGKNGALTTGAASYLIISLLFLFLLTWDRGALILVYTLLGIGRATYEGTLRAVFADYFTAEKEGAFGIIILFTGTASTIGYILSVTGSLTCDKVSRYCLQYSDGTIHNVLVMELVTIVIAMIAVPSLWRAAWMFRSRIIDDRTE